MDHKPIKSPVGKKATQIWEAYQEVLKELKSKEAAPNTQAIATAHRKDAAIKLAHSLNAEELTNKLEDFAIGLTEAINTFHEIDTAISEKKKELQNVHQLEYEANATVALLRAKDKLLAERQEAADTLINEAKEKAKEIIEVAKADKHAAQTEIMEAKMLAQKSQARQQEDWEYTFSRERRSKVDKIEDEINEKLKALAVRDEEIAKREGAIKDLDTTIQDLKDQLEAKEKSTAKLIDAAVKEAVDRANKSAAIQKTIAEKALQSENAVLQAKNESMQDAIAELRARLERAEKQVEAANTRVTTIATNALKADADAATVAKISEIAAGSGQKK